MMVCVYVDFVAKTHPVMWVVRVNIEITSVEKGAHIEKSKKTKNTSIMRYSMCTKYDI